MAQIQFYWKPGCTSCVKAHELLTKKRGAKNIAIRHLIKEPLSRAEIKALAKRVGGAQELIAPKRKKEAVGLTGEKLVDWLSEDGGRIRRPIIMMDDLITVGFASPTQELLKENL